MAERVIDLTLPDRAAHELRLEPGTPVRVNFHAGTFGSTVIEVLSHDGAAPVYVTSDGTPPVVRGARCDVLPAAVTSIEVPAITGRRGMVVVRLLSEGAPLVSVSRRQP